MIGTVVDAALSIPIASIVGSTSTPSNRPEHVKGIQTQYKKKTGIKDTTSNQDEYLVKVEGRKVYVLEWLVVLL